MDFLDSVLQAERHKEEAIKRESAEQLEVFRKQQESAAQETTDTQETKEEEAAHWSTKKRRRKETDLRAMKLRKTSTTDNLKDSEAKKEGRIDPVSPDVTVSKTDPVQDPSSTSRTPSKSTSPSATALAPSLGLEGYSSDED